MNCVLQTLDAIILDCFYQLISFYEKWFTYNVMSVICP